jgi:hypothetical protein
MLNCGRKEGWRGGRKGMKDEREGRKTGGREDGSKGKGEIAYI